MSSDNVFSIPAGLPPELQAKLAARAASHGMTPVSGGDSAAAPSSSADSRPAALASDTTTNLKSGQSSSMALNDSANVIEIPVSLPDFAKERLAKRAAMHGMTTVSVEAPPPVARPPLDGVLKELQGDFKGTDHPLSDSTIHSILTQVAEGKDPSRVLQDNIPTPLMRNIARSIADGASQWLIARDVPAPKYEIDGLPGKHVYNNTGLKSFAQLPEDYPNKVDLIRANMVHTPIELEPNRTVYPFDWGVNKIKVYQELVTFDRAHPDLFVVGGKSDPRLSQIRRDLQVRLDNTKD